MTSIKKTKLAVFDENRMAETLAKQLAQQGNREAEGVKKSSKRLEKHLPQLRQCYSAISLI